MEAPCIICTSLYFTNSGHVQETSEQALLWLWCFWSLDRFWKIRPWVRSKMSSITWPWNLIHGNLSMAQIPVFFQTLLLTIDGNHAWKNRSFRVNRAFSQPFHISTVGLCFFQNSRIIILWYVQHVSTLIPPHPQLNLFNSVNNPSYLTPITLWWLNIANWKMAISLVDFPSKNGDFP